MLMRPMKSCAYGHMIEVFKDVYDYLQDRNLKPNLHVLKMNAYEQSNCL